MTDKTEIFDIVDEEDRVIGQASRRECHGNPELVHRVAHVLVLDGRGRLLLQKRSMNKDIQPGRWDTSVGGHLDPGEGYRQAAVREMAEELGIEGADLTFLYRSKIRNEIESENVATFLVRHDGEVRFEPKEIDEVRHWASDEIEAALCTGVFTPNFEQEWEMFCRWRRRNSETASEKESEDTMKYEEIYRATLEKWGEEAQYDQAVEECAELIASLKHFRREKVDEEAVISELADVSLMVGQLTYMFGEEKVEKAIETKIAKLRGLLDPA